MTTNHKGPIVNGDLARLKPRLAAKIQVARLRKRLAERASKNQNKLVTDWWEANHGAGEG